MVISALLKHVERIIVGMAIGSTIYDSVSTTNSINLLGRCAVCSYVLQ